ncbi:DUF4232 domain-containing protein [Streptomyces sp. NPDC020983]|uniref:DUF4232 domain-containing protein n=1 Tax=Streptomyces sp. NPDC020983 TaxID=3365106 RepID=UPI0037ADF80C
MTKHARTTAFAVLGLAVALSLTACGSDGSGKDTSAKDTSAKASPSASSSSPSSPSSRPSPSSDSGSSTDGGSAGKKSAGAANAAADSGGTKAGAGDGGAGQDGGNLPFCTTKNLAVTAENVSPDASTGTIDITMTNRGSAACSVTGFAGIGITDEDTTTNPVERGRAEPRITDLRAGGAAVFNISYEIDNSGKSLTRPTAIQVTPPNQTSYVTVKWPAGAGDIKGSYTDVQVYPTHNK